MTTKLNIKITSMENAYPIPHMDNGTPMIVRVDGIWHSGYFDGNEHFIADYTDTIFSEGQIEYWFEIPDEIA